MKKILMVASEASPFAKTGGLADVIGGLPLALMKRDADVRVIMPKYEYAGKSRRILRDEVTGELEESEGKMTLTDILNENQIEPEYLCHFYVNLGWRHLYCGIEQIIYRGVTYYFIDNEFYFKRDNCYGYGDDAERFAFFCRAVLEAIPHLNFIPDIIHCHDWQAGMIPVLLNAQYRSLDRFKDIRTMFTIHNLKFQGIYGVSEMKEWFGLGDEYFTSDKLEFFGGGSFMKGGLLYSDWITTVSDTYAEEIKYPFYGEGLDGLLRAKENSLSGIVNGIDYDVYNPKSDPYIYQNYSKSTIKNKKINKIELQKKLGLIVDEEIPMIGLVSRLTDQKGLALIEGVFDEIMGEEVQLVILGSGDRKYEELFMNAVNRYPGKVSVMIAYSDPRAHRIYAAADFFLMPSLFEPCGLGQLISMRYGTLPIVRETGGLKDTVISYNEETGEGNGFSFTNYNAHDLLYTIRRALTIYKKKRFVPNSSRQRCRRTLAGIYPRENIRSCTISKNRSEGVKKSIFPKRSFQCPGCNKDADGRINKVYSHVKLNLWRKLAGYEKDVDISVKCCIEDAEWGVRMKKRKLLYVAAEISPYANAGGLGEVARSFPKALKESGAYEIRRVMPYHKAIKETMKYLIDYPVEIEDGFETCIVKRDSRDKDMITYFISNDRYFYRDNIYGYEDDGIRYFFFCKAVMELLRRLDYKPDIVHTNDWHTGMLPLLIKKEFPGIKTVYTIHNISYHGFVPASYLTGLLSRKEQCILGWPEWLNFMSAGIIYSDLLTTVSPGYCEEIKKRSQGCGMAPLIEQREKPIVGILNGIDREWYDPMAEGELEYPYDSQHMELKYKNRTWLRKHYSLPEDERPLVAMVTRLDYSKGIDVLLNAISLFDFTKLQLIVLGSGNSYYQGLLANITSSHPDSLVVDFEYSVEMAKRIYAGADIYLMPSLFEPCGLGQLYAMRYGTVPIVNPVGGLKDTVIDDRDKPKSSNGFYMKEWSGQALNEALNRALEAYHSLEWKCFIKNCMDYDSSWERSVSLYFAYYDALLSPQQKDIVMRKQLRD